MREAYTLLNRLASQPALSKFTSEAFTLGGTVTRLSRKNEPSSRHIAASVDVGTVTKFSSVRPDHDRLGKQACTWMRL